MYPVLAELEMIPSHLLQYKNNAATPAKGSSESPKEVQEGEAEEK